VGKCYITRVAQTYGHPLYALSIPLRSSTNLFSQEWYCPWESCLVLLLQIQKSESWRRSGYGYPAWTLLGIIDGGGLSRQWVQQIKSHFRLTTVNSCYVAWARARRHVTALTEHKERVAWRISWHFRRIAQMKDFYLLNSQPLYGCVCPKRHTPSEHMRSTSLFHELKRL
jgi:hypothetical protein